MLLFGFSQLSLHFYHIFFAFAFAFALSLSGLLEEIGLVFSSASHHADFFDFLSYPYLAFNLARVRIIITIIARSLPSFFLLFFSFRFEHNLFELVYELFLGISWERMGRGSLVGVKVVNRGRL